MTLTFNQSVQMFQMALLLLKENNCAKLFWNPCMNVEVLAQTSSIYDHFMIWPSSVTLLFNLSEQMFQMALLLLKKNNYTKLFLNPWINVEVMARTLQAQFMTILSFDLQVWPWPSTYLTKCLKQHC